MLSDNALRYVVNHLLTVAFPSRETLHFSMKREAERLSVKVEDQVSLCLNLLSDEETEKLRKGFLPVQSVAVGAGVESIPMFKTSSEVRENPEYDAATGTLHLPFDIVTLPFLLLSKLDECDGSPRDRHGRFQFQYSLASRYGFATCPIVDEYALLLRRWVQEANVSFWFSWRPRTPQIIATHDIDLLQRFHSPFQAYKSMFGRDLLIERSSDVFRQSWNEYREWMNNPVKDPYIMAISRFAQQSQSRSVPAVFFFKAQLEGENGATYNYCVPAVKRLVKQLESNGLTVGLHGSYDSADSRKVLGYEKQRMDSLTSSPVTHARQHYLRFYPEKSKSVQHWKAVGIRHDYTLGYARQPGFRCGTCHPFPLYDLEHDCPTDITEHPLVVMDGSLFDYLKLSVDESVALIRLLKKRCEKVEGDFVYLWHNHTTTRSFRTYYEKSTQAIYETMASQQ